MEVGVSAVVQFLALVLCAVAGTDDASLPLSMWFDFTIGDDDVTPLTFLEEDEVIGVISLFTLNLSKLFSGSSIISIAVTSFVPSTFRLFDLTGKEGKNS